LEHFLLLAVVEVLEMCLLAMDCQVVLVVVEVSLHRVQLELGLLIKVLLEG
jgi:hypothetical protein